MKIWEKIDDTKIKFNPDEFCEIFAKSQISPILISPLINKEEKICFSKPDRQRKIEKVLNKIKIKSIDISDALLSYNETILTEEASSMLYPIFPDTSEYEEISKLIEIMENEDEFAQCDLFILLIGGIKYNRERLQAIIFKNIYLEKCDEILEFVKIFFKRI